MGQIVVLQVVQQVVPERVKAVLVVARVVAKMSVLGAEAVAQIRVQEQQQNNITIDFMEQKNKNEEILSRRVFFKNAAKKALPILGVVALTQLPIFQQQAQASKCIACSDKCSSNCDITCTGCKGNCGGACSNGAI